MILGVFLNEVKVSAKDVENEILSPSRQFHSVATYAKNEETPQPLLNEGPVG